MMCWVPRYLVQGKLGRFFQPQGESREIPRGESQAAPADVGKTGEGKALVFIRRVWGGKEDRRMMTDVLPASCGSVTSPKSHLRDVPLEQPGCQGQPQDSFILKAVTEALCPMALIHSPI